MAGPMPCLRCGYDLSGTPWNGRCPECSAPVAEYRDALDPKAIRRRRGRLAGEILILFGAAVVLGILVRLLGWLR